MKKVIVSYCLFMLTAISMAPQVKAKQAAVDKTDMVVLIASKDVNIYPNPAIDHIYIKFEEAVANEVNVEVRSFIGNDMVISSVVQQSNLIKIDIADLPAGHYYAVITLDKEKTLKKFIKRD